MNPYLLERKSLKISLVLVLVLMVWGAVFNAITDSNIVELDAGAYVISGIIGLITIYVSRLQERPRTTTHPLGYSGFIPILNLIRNLMVILICIKAISESIGAILSGPSPDEHATLFLYAGMTFLINAASYFYMNRNARRLNSTLLKTDALEWKLDTFSNISILAAFALAYGLEYTGHAKLSAYVDPVICILLSVYMCIAPGKLFFENVQLLSVSSVDRETQEMLIGKFRQASPFFTTYPTHFTILNVAGIYWTNFEVKKPENATISLEQLTEAAKVCQAIMDETHPKNKLSYFYDVEQTGNS